MRYLITGGAGLIGSRLAESLLYRGDEVTILDNLSSGTASNLTAIKSKLIFEHTSILENSAVRTLVKKSDFIVHLAAAVGVFNIVNKPLESLITNLEGTQNVVKAANEFGKPILIASTSEIYGKNEKVPLGEEDDRIVGNPLKTRWSYSEAKALDESFAYFYYLERKLPVRIVRFFNITGPRQTGNYGMVMPRFIEAALNNDPIFIYGSGEQIRCFCHVDDAVQALLLVMDSEKSIGQVFNIGNNEQISITNLAKKVVEITGSKSEILAIPYSEAYSEGFEDMLRRVPDISKIQKVLGWAPKISLDRIIKDFKESRAIKN
jgi:UDP-glucose 4-epimerase